LEVVGVVSSWSERPEPVEVVNVLCVWTLKRRKRIVLLALTPGVVV